MFNWKMIIATLRACVACMLLFVPLTNQAAPAENDHIALGDQPAAVLHCPVNGPGLLECAGDTAFASDVSCQQHCTDVFNSCEAACEGSKWCVLGCTVAHAWCVYSCQDTSRG